MCSLTPLDRHSVVVDTEVMINYKDVLKHPSKHLSLDGLLVTAQIKSPTWAGWRRQDATI